MKCPICGYELDAGSKFCAKCGKRIPRCPTCGEVLYERSRFCDKDGTPLPPELFADFPQVDGEEARVVAGISAVVAETLEGTPERSAERPAPPDPEPPVRPTPPPPRPAPRPEPPKKKKKGNAGIVIAVVIVILLAVATALGTYYVLENGLPFEDGLPFLSREDDSSEDDDRDDDSGDRDDRDDDDDEDGGNEQDDEIQKALDQADVYASAREYRNALTVIREALEENPKSRKLKNAQREYEDLCVAAVMEEADRLMGEARFDEAQRVLDEGLALVPANGDLLDKVRELENAMAQADNAPPVTMGGVTSIEASSYLSEPKLNLYHVPGRVVDGDLSTAWVEGIDGHGIGESITFRFDRTYLISGMRVNAGYQKSAELYEKNDRPAAVTLSFSDGTERTVQLQDVNSLQDIPFTLPVETQSVRLTIVSVYPGSTFEDTVFSEISFY